MRDVIAFLFGALTLFTGYYVWWSHRRFNRVKELLTDVIGRTQRLDMNMDRIGLTVSLFSGSIAEHNRRVEFICSHERKPRPLGRGGSESASSWVGEEIVLQDLT